MKAVMLEGEFPDLKGNIYATGHGKASTVRAAFSRAVNDMMKQQNVVGKHISTIKLTASITNVAKEVRASESVA